MEPTKEMDLVGTRVVVTVSPSGRISYDRPPPRAGGRTLPSMGCEHVPPCTPRYHLSD